MGAALNVLVLTSPALAKKPSPPADAIDRAADAVERLETAIVKSRTQKTRLAKLLNTLNAELSEIQAQMVRSAKTTQSHEATLSKVEARLAELSEDQANKSISLQHKRRSLAALGAGLQRISRRPAETVLMRPGAPVEAVRTAMLLEFAIPRVNDRAEALRRDINEIVMLRREIEDQRAALKQTTEELNRERAQLAALSQEKQKLYNQLHGKSRAIDTEAGDLARSAQNLRQLLQGLQTKQNQRNAAAKRLSDLAVKSGPPPEPQTTAPVPRTRQLAMLTPQIKTDTDVSAGAFAPDLQPISKQKGNLAQPVIGKVVLGYGSKIARGRTSKGITVETREQAQVIAPYDGKVLYAGEFRAYGQIIIIDHGEGYHTLLAGLDRVDARSGQNLLAGEPVGMMGKITETQRRNVSASGRKYGAPRLYVEMRHSGAPINPVPWLAASDKVQKVKG